MGEGGRRLPIHTGDGTHRDSGVHLLVPRPIGAPGPRDPLQLLQQVPAGGLSPRRCSFALRFSQPDTFVARTERIRAPRGRCFDIYPPDGSDSALRRCAPPIHPPPYLPFLHARHTLRFPARQCAQHLCYHRRASFLPRCVAAASPTPSTPLRHPRRRQPSSSAARAAELVSLLSLQALGPIDGPPQLARALGSAARAEWPRSQRRRHALAPPLAAAPRQPVSLGRGGARRGGGHRLSGGMRSQARRRCWPPCARACRGAARCGCGSRTTRAARRPPRSPLSSACARQDSTRFPERHEMIPGDVDTF